jgi:hypothetical protein
MVNPNRFYTYAYLRKDKTPYYIGKGTRKRAYTRKRIEIKPPKDTSRILILKQNLNEEEAFKHEIYMIAVFGRKDLGTGILHNKTDGGEGCRGIIITDEYIENKIKAGKKSKELGIGIHGIPKEERVENARKAGLVGGKNTSSQKWICLDTGHITNAGALTTYQRNRGIDTSKRKRIS